MKPSALVIAALLSAFAPFAPLTFTARAVNPAAPATQPAGDISALVAQLGDDDFHVRLDAARKLKAMGPAVIPAMQEARKSQDPEIHARAEDILEDFAHPPGSVPQPTGPGNQMMRASFVNGVKIVDVRQPGRTIHLEQDGANIYMKVTGRLDGLQVTREFKARTPEQLKRENPEAFALFQQNAGNNNPIRFGLQANNIRINGNVNIRLNGVFVGPAGIQLPGQQLRIIPAPPAPINPNGDNLEGLENNLLGQMKARQMPDALQDDVKGLLKQLREGLPPANNADVDIRIREYDRRCDALRKRLAELNLPDPGNILPPPAAGRLGINVAPEVIQGEGLVITHILPDSRAEKLGLKVQDQILKVNGKDIRTTAELRKVVTDNPTGLVVNGLREGVPFERREPEKAAQP